MMKKSWLELVVENAIFLALVATFSFVFSPILLLYAFFMEFLKKFEKMRVTVVMNSWERFRLCTAGGLAVLALITVLAILPVEIITSAFSLQYKTKTIIYQLLAVMGTCFGVYVAFRDSEPVEVMNNRW